MPDGTSGLLCPACSRENPAGAPVCCECRAPIPTSFAAGRYVMERLLGEGADKRVYLARDTRLDRYVALALIKTAGNGTGLARFHREARALGRLGDHPNIITIYDVGEEAGQPYIVEQYVAGGDLEGLLRQAKGHPLALSTALRIAGQLCRGLEYAHERGVVHRDLKPGNVWLTEDGTAKLGDFGLAAAPDLSRLTVAGTMLGTISYMPPEQALGQPPDARSDLYGLGALLYEMVTGRAPFVGDDPVAIISQHINTPPVAPSWHNPEVPRALDALVLRLLAKTPEARPESAAAVRDALAAISETPEAVADRVEPYEPNPLDRLAGGVFVGRSLEMGELRADLEQAIAGRGGLVLLGGEPGIGKTRTAEELATYASLRKAQVLWGRCYEGEGAPPYWPWMQIVRAYVHACDPQTLRTEMGSEAADIARVFSVVSERLPDLPSTPALPPEQARFRLFDGITTFLRNAARHRPLVLILDDLQWADRPSLLLLEFLSREVQDSRLLLLGTYRDVEVRRGLPLASTLAQLAQVSRGVILRGLSAQDVARFIELTAGIQPAKALVELVHAETEGNAFFVGEIVRLLAADGRLEAPLEGRPRNVAVPQSIRGVIDRRLGQLSPECNRVLGIASVVGREFDLKVLARASDLSTDRLLEVLDEATAARVVTEVPGSPDRHAFAHALVRETLYEELSAIRRARLHRHVGKTLEELHGAKPEPYLTELAYHFCAAARTGDADKAVSYAWRAGDGALSRLAYEEGARLYEMALECLNLRAEPDEEQRCELLLALGEAWRRAGDIEKMRGTFQRTAELTRKLGSPQQLARAALGFGLWRERMTGNVDEVEVRLLEEALGALGEADSPLRAKILARLAVSLYHDGAQERRASLSRQAVDMARRLGDQGTLAYTLNCRRWALWGTGSSDEQLADATEGLHLAEQIGDVELALESRLWRLVGLLELGDIPAVDEEIAAHARLAAELRVPHYLRFSILLKAMRALLVGRFEEAERFAEQALAIGQRMKSELAVRASWGPITLIRREQGRLGELEPLIRSALDRTPAVPALRCGLASVYTELGREEEARAEFERVAARAFADLPRDASWLVSLVLMAETCSFLGDTRRAAMLYDLLLSYAGHNVVVGTGLVCYGSASLYLGLLAATMTRWGEARVHFEAALELNTRMGAWPWVARTEHAFAAMHLAREAPGDREKALALLDRALETAQALGMKSLVEKALALKTRALGVDRGDIKSSIGAVARAVERERPDLGTHAGPDGTVTLLFTDIEGFTAMTERLGDWRAQEVLRAHNALVRAQVAAHAGFEVKASGDGFMIAFQSIRRALRCAIAVQRGIAAYDSQHPAEPIRVRIGLHTGEVIAEEEDFFGRNVIVAARIAAQARGGEILVSSLLKELIESAGEFRFDEGRQAELKGLTGRHRVYALGWSGTSV